MLQYIFIQKFYLLYKHDPYHYLTGGADPNLQTQDGDSALMAAVSQRNHACVKSLISLGADVNARNAQTDWTVLHLAANLGDPQLITILLDAGAKVSNTSAG